MLLQARLLLRQSKRLTTRAWRTRTQWDSWQQRWLQNFFNMIRTRNERKSSNGSGKEIVGRGIRTSVRSGCQVREGGFWTLVNSTIGAVELVLRSSFAQEYVPALQKYISLTGPLAGAGKSYITSQPLFKLFNFAGHLSLTTFFPKPTTSNLKELEFFTSISITIIERIRTLKPSFEVFWKNCSISVTQYQTLWKKLTIDVSKASCPLNQTEHCGSRYLRIVLRNSPPYS